MGTNESSAEDRKKVGLIWHPPLRSNTAIVARSQPPPSRWRTRGLSIAGVVALTIPNEPLGLGSRGRVVVRDVSAGA